MGNNISINANNILNPANAQGAKAAGKNKSFFAGNTQLNAKNNPLIAQKKQLAGKQAMKLIGDAFARDQKFAGSVDELRAKKQAIRDEFNANQKQIAGMEDEIASLQEKYGIDPESQEQKDLDILRKYQSAKNGVKTDPFTDEERARLKELEGTERTEYQARALSVSNEQDHLKHTNQQLDGQMVNLTATISTMRIDNLKNQDMIKADEAAEKIMDAARKEAVGMMWQDAKEAVEEKQEEEQKKGEKLAEEREKFEERLEESKEKRKEEQEIIENANKADLQKVDVDAKSSDDTAVSKAQQEIQKILVDNNLLDEDLKGLKINLGF